MRLYYAEPKLATKKWRPALPRKSGAWHVITDDGDRVLWLASLDSDISRAPTHPYYLWNIVEWDFELINENLLIYDPPWETP